MTYLIAKKLKLDYNNLKVVMGLYRYLKHRKIKRFRKKHKFGLCLSGGGTRGFSYIGVFKALEEAGIKFDAIAGTSAGSLFASLYASGLTYEEMHIRASKMKNSDFRSAKLGFLPSKMDNLANVLREALPVTKIEDMKIPYYAVAVDVKTGKEIDFDKGDIIPIVCGSCAIPGVFYPVAYNNMVLVDGGVSNNIPVDVLRRHGCDFVVTIDCHKGRGGGTNSNNVITQFLTSVGIMMANNSKNGLILSDLVIEPDLEKFNSLKVEGREEMIEEGYRVTKAAIPKIEKLLGGGNKKKTKLKFKF